MKIKRNVAIIKFFVFNVLICIFINTYKSTSAAGLRKFLTFKISEDATGLKIKPKIRDFCNNNSIIGWCSFNKNKTLEGELYGIEPSLKEFQKWFTDLKNPMYKGRTPVFI